MARRRHQIDRGIDKIMAVIRACNRYFEKTTPWELAKSEDKSRLATVLYTSTEALRIISGLLYPIIPNKMNKGRILKGCKYASMGNT